MSNSASTHINQRGGAIRSSDEAAVMACGAKGLRYSANVNCQPVMGGTFNLSEVI